MIEKDRTLDYLLFRVELQALLGYCKSVSVKLSKNDPWANGLLQYVNKVEKKLEELPLNNVMLIEYSGENNGP
jgi:hypothetical protein